MRLNLAWGGPGRQRWGRFRRGGGPSGRFKARERALGLRPASVVRLLAPAALGFCPNWDLAHPGLSSGMESAAVAPVPVLPLVMVSTHVDRGCAPDLLDPVPGDSNRPPGAHPPHRRRR